MKIIISIIVSFIVCICVPAHAQKNTDADMAKVKEIQHTIIELLIKAPNNYNDMQGTEMLYKSDFIMYNATATPAMHAQKYYVTYVTSNKKSYYLSYYTKAEDIKLATAAAMSMSDYTGDTWKTEEKADADKNVTSTLLYCSGVKVGNIRFDKEEKTLSLSLGFFNDPGTETNAFITKLKKYINDPGNSDVVIEKNPIINNLQVSDTEQKEYGSPLADSLMYLHSIANNNYKGLGIPAVTKEDTSYWSELPKMLGADKALCYRTNEHGLMICLSYLRTNPLAKKVKKDVMAFFETITKDETHHLNRSYEQNVSIEEYGRDIFNYMLPLDKKSERFIEIYVYQTLPVLADETIYNGKIPTTVTNSDMPQVWELDGKAGAGSYQRYNGIFKNGVLMKGYKTFHGYGGFYDGTWFSEEWAPKGPYTPVEIVFYPEGSNDMIYGHFNDREMKTFVGDQRYTSSAKHAIFGFDPGSPKWLITTFMKHQMDEYYAKIAEEAKYNSEHPYTNYGNNNNNYTPNKANDKWTYCNCCKGLGYTEVYTPGKEYQNYDRYGNKQSTTSLLKITCTCCHGTGK